MASTGKKDFISVRDLKKSYLSKGREVIEAISGVSFEVREREFVSVVGPSGCGKSTLLKILAGLLDKTGGEVFVAGEPVNGPRKDIGVVFQDAVLLPWRSVLENVMLPVDFLKLDHTRYRRKALDLLEMVGLRGFEHKYSWELSGGMQQRVSIARSLIHNPSLLLMDEPFGALDAMTRESMNMELLRISRKSEKTIFFITHSISEAVFLSDRVMVLSGRPCRITEIVEVGLPRERSLDLVFTDRFGEYTKKIRENLNSCGGGEGLEEI